MDAKIEEYFDWLCRTCMREVDDTAFNDDGEQQQWQSICDEVEEWDSSISIAELLSNIMPQIEINQGDNLPKKICQACLQQLTSLHRFQQMCIQSDKELREMVAKNIANLNEAVSDISAAEEELYFEIIEQRSEVESVDSLPIEQQQTSINDPLQNVGEAIETCRNSQEDINNLVKDEPCYNNDEHFGTDNHQEEVTVAARNSFAHVCDICKKKFRESRYLKEHIKRHGLSEEEKKADYVRKNIGSPYFCPECGKSFTNSSNLNTHRLCHSGVRPFECPICPARFFRKRDVRVHKVIHETIKRHICDICGEGFKKSDGLTAHKKCHTGERPYKCDYCERRFGRADHKRRHMLKHTGEKPYKCKYCDSAFTQQSELMKHLRTHLGENVFGCTLCPSAFRRASERRAHFVTHKNDDEETRERNMKALKEKEADLLSNCVNNGDSKQQVGPETTKKRKRMDYSCEICKNNENIDDLKDHIHTHHGERPYLCPECGKSFTNSSNLRNHRLRHSDARPFECPICPARFPCKGDISVHKAVHKAIKPHICDICGEGFSNKCGLRAHIKCHTGERPYKCDYCEMRFVRADTQRRHMRTHTGEKPYKCKYCDRAFSQQNDQMKHLRIHLGENVYGCTLCPSAFRSASERRAHFVTHKNDDEETRERNMKALKDKEADLLLKCVRNEA